jgi:5-formyltetrahydrofolate cyclo-ligase
MNIKKQKIELRKKVLSDRDQMSTAEIIRASAVISSEIFALEPFKDARVIAAYMSFGSEFLTDGFVDESLRLGKILVLPRVDKVSGSLSFHKWNGEINQLSEGRWGIREPNPLICELIQVSMIDFVLVPGVAFTNDGFRLGYGGGYYDNVISKLTSGATAVAAAFSLQLVSSLPRENHDLGVDILISA